MKSNKLAPIPFVIFILILLPFLVGFSEVPLNSKFKEAVEQKIANSTNNDQIAINIGLLPTVDKILADNSQRAVWNINLRIASLIDSILDVFNNDQLTFVFYGQDGIKKTEHTPSFDENLYNIDADTLLNAIENSKNEKELISTVINDYMDPLGEPDILLVTKYFLSTQQQPALEIVLFFKTNKTISEKIIYFHDNIICKEQGDLEEKLCKETEEKISEEIKNIFIGDTENTKNNCNDELISLLPGECIEKKKSSYSKVFLNEDSPKKLSKKVQKNKKKPVNIPSNGQQKISKVKKNNTSQPDIYITQLSFIDTSSYTLLKPDKNSLINKSVNNSLMRANQINPSLKFNEKGHNIQNNDTNILNFIDTFYDPNKGKKDSLESVIKEIMIPNNVDCIITGEYKEEKDVIHVTPTLLIKKNQEKILKHLEFDRKDFECFETDFFGDKSKKICIQAQQEIENATLELLQNLK